MNSHTLSKFKLILTANIERGLSVPKITSIPPPPPPVTSYFVTVFCWPLYTIFINGRPAKFGLVKFSKKFMFWHYQAVQNLLSWEMFGLTAAKLWNFQIQGICNCMGNHNQASLASPAFMLSQNSNAYIFSLNEILQKIQSRKHCFLLVVVSVTFSCARQA